MSKSCLSKKRVRFSNVRIREFDITVGDNPSVRGGPPLSLDWHVKNEVSVDIDCYEQNKPCLRKSLPELIMPAYERTKCLLDAGVTVDEIARATLEASEIKQSRSETSEGLPHRFAYRKAMRDAGKKFQRIIGSRSGVVPARSE